MIFPDKIAKAPGRMWFYDEKHISFIPKCWILGTCIQCDQFGLIVHRHPLMSPEVYCRYLAMCWHCVTKHFSICFDKGLERTIYEHGCFLCDKPDQFA